MSLPPIDPDKTTAGIALDPQTLERVIPESRRPDGTIRKQIKIRPGFTPQEDVGRFRGTRQAQMDVNVLPKGHIMGWAPSPLTIPSRNANKKAKRRKKKREQGKVPDNWEEDDKEEDDHESGPQDQGSTTPLANSSTTTITTTDLPAEDKDQSASPADVEDDLSSNLDKLNVK